MLSNIKICSPHYSYSQMTLSSDDQTRLVQIFHPYACEKSRAVKDERRRFVHYTSAEAAMAILRSREVWMRKSSCMNDFMEVTHGRDCLVNAYNCEIGAEFKRALEAIFPGTSRQVQETFDTLLPQLFTETYLTCVSEHLEAEDVFGRLSMWRAYGKGTGVALVLKSAAFPKSFKCVEGLLESGSLFK